MVRESLFNIVRELLSIASSSTSSPAPVPWASRPRAEAERAIFVEKDRENVSLIIRNIATLRYEDRAVASSSPTPTAWSSAFEPPTIPPIARSYPPIAIPKEPQPA